MTKRTGCVEETRGGRILDRTTGLYLLYDIKRGRFIPGYKSADNLYTGIRNGRRVAFSKEATLKNGWEWIDPKSEILRKRQQERLALRMKAQKAETSPKKKSKRQSPGS